MIFPLELKRKYQSSFENKKQFLRGVQMKEHVPVLAEVQLA
jgi:hypothetical protein